MGSMPAGELSEPLTIEFFAAIIMEEVENP
jgi:hypothetical protein